MRIRPVSINYLVDATSHPVYRKPLPLLVVQQVREEDRLVQPEPAPIPIERVEHADDSDFEQSCFPYDDDDDDDGERTLYFGSDHRDSTNEDSINSLLPGAARNPSLFVKASQLERDTVSVKAYCTTLGLLLWSLYLSQRRKRLTSTPEWNIASPDRLPNQQQSLGIPTVFLQLIHAIWSSRASTKQQQQHVMMSPNISNLSRPMLETPVGLNMSSRHNNDPWSRPMLDTPMPLEVSDQSTPAPGSPKRSVSKRLAFELLSPKHSRCYKKDIRRYQHRGSTDNEGTRQHRGSTGGEKRATRNDIPTPLYRYPSKTPKQVAAIPREPQEQLMPDVRCANNEDAKSRPSVNEVHDNTDRKRQHPIALSNDGAPRHSQTSHHDHLDARDHQHGATEADVCDDDREQVGNSLEQSRLESHARPRSPEEFEFPVNDYGDELGSPRDSPDHKGTFGSPCHSPPRQIKSEPGLKAVNDDTFVSPRRSPQQLIKIEQGMEEQAEREKKSHKKDRKKHKKSKKSKKKRSKEAKRSERESKKRKVDATMASKRTQNTTASKITPYSERREPLVPVSLNNLDFGVSDLDDEFFDPRVKPVKTYKGSVDKRASIIPVSATRDAQHSMQVFSPQVEQSAKSQRVKTPKAQKQPLSPNGSGRKLETPRASPVPLKRSHAQLSQTDQQLDDGLEIPHASPEPQYHNTREANGRNSSEKRQRLESKVVVHTICSESFLETSSQAVASLVSGAWSRTPENGGTSNQQIVLHDTSLLDEIGVDFELAGKGAILVQRVSTWESERDLKDLIREMVKLTSLGRYTSLYVALCIDTQISPQLAKHIAFFQSTSFGSSECVVSFQMVTQRSLAVVVAHRILQSRAQFGDELDSSTFASLNSCQSQALFLLRIASSLTATAAIRCLLGTKEGSLRTLQQVLVKGSSGDQSGASAQLQSAASAAFNQGKEAAWDC